MSPGSSTTNLNLLRRRPLESAMMICRRCGRILVLEPDQLVVWKPSQHYFREPSCIHLHQRINAQCLSWSHSGMSRGNIALGNKDRTRPPHILRVWFHMQTCYSSRKITTLCNLHLELNRATHVCNCQSSLLVAPLEADSPPRTKPLMLGHLPAPT